MSSIHPLAWGLLALLVPAFAAYLWQKRKVLAGDYDLLIDSTRRCITLPRARLKQDGLLREIPFAKLTAVEIRDSTTTRVGNEPVKDVFLNCASPGPGPVRLRAFADRTDAESFAASLRSQIGLPPPIPAA